MKDLVKYSDINTLRLLQYTVFASVILYFGKNIFIPVSVALLISFILYPLCVWLERMGIRRLWASAIALGLVIVGGLLVVALLVFQFITFVDEWPALQGKLLQSLHDLSVWLFDAFGITRERQQLWIDKILNQSGANIPGLLRDVISSSAFSGALLVLVPIYSILILNYRKHWMKILYQLFPNEEKQSVRNLVSLTINTYYKFINGMAIVYLVVGILNSAGLFILGVPHAILFGFIASILTFIPYVGIMIGSLLPIAVAWITYDSIWYPLGVILMFAFVQYLEANVIFPVAVSQRLNVNTLVMLLAIFIGGLLWGMMGMILFVPFVGIVKLIADHNPRWKILSMLLG